MLVQTPSQQSTSLCRWEDTKCSSLQPNADGSQLVSLEEVSKRNYTAIHAYTEVTMYSN